MDQIRNLINWLQNINQNQITDLVIAISVAMVFYIVVSIIIYYTLKFTSKTKGIKVKKLALYTPIKVFAKFFSTYIGLQIVSLPAVVMAAVNKIMKIIVIWIVADIIARLISPKAKIFKKIEKSDKFEDANHITIKYATKVLRAVVYIIAGFIIINELGYNLTGLIAGFGLGSVVIALAAQDLAKSLLAGASILLDKSYKVGDWLQVGTSEGTVEHISIRSTRIRTLNDSVIIIPNSTMVNTAVVNWSHLQKRRYDFNLKLPLNTPETSVEKIKKRIKFVLSTNENVIENSVKVNFSEISNDSLNIGVYLYTNIIPFEEYLNFKTEINMLVLKILEEEQVKLAYPGQDIYIRTQE